MRLESTIGFSNMTIMEDLDKGNFSIVGGVWRGKPKEEKVWRKQEAYYKLLITEK